MTENLETPKYYQLHADDIVNLLDSNVSKGLTETKVEELLTQYGTNEIETKEEASLFSLFIDQLKNPLVMLLIGASAIAMVTGEVFESILIISIVCFMAALGVFLENKASKAVSDLKKFSAHLINVLRNGQVDRVNAKNLVPGDILLLHQGDKVPADARVITADDLVINESILTGESVPVGKNAQVISETCTMGDQRNMVFAGTFVVEGKGKAIVVDTGLTTQLGKIAKQLAEAENAPTPLQEQLEKLSKILLVGTISLCSGIIALGVYRGQSFLDSLLQSLSLAIAFIPEGLSAVMTVTLALGAKEMVKKSVIIKRLIAAEGLGSVSILATDKTGTITTGQMTVENIWMPNQEVLASEFKAKGLLEKKVLEVIRYCNNKKGSTEIALVEFLEKLGVNFEIEERVKEHRFSSDTKKMTVIVDLKGELTGYSKGAPEVLIPLCENYIDYKSGETKEFTKAKQAEAVHEAETYADKGYRVICLATRHYHKGHKVGIREEDEKNLTFIALINILDPLRSEVPDTIATFRSAGVRPVMITGDHPFIARTIARQAGIIAPEEKALVITGIELDKYFAGERNLTMAEILEANVFARVTPDHKNKLLQMYNDHDYVTAMAGDGVNDAVAISKANVGIAVSGGSDIVKDVADVIVTGGYDALANAVEIGRVIMQRTRLYLHYILSGNVCEIGAFLLAIGFNLPMPLTAVNLLIINLLTDAAPAMAMAVEKGDRHLMEEKPRVKGEGIINRYMWFSMGVQAVIASIYLFFVFKMSLPQGLVYAQTATFTAYIFQKLLRAFTARSLKESVLTYGVFTNKAINMSVLLGFSVWLLIVYIFPDFFGSERLSVETLEMIIPLSLLFPLAEELSKLLHRKVRWFGR